MKDLIGTSLEEVFKIAENHEFRSNYIRSLIHSSDITSQEIFPNICSIPKVLMQFWHDTCAIPEDVQKCMESWNAVSEMGITRILFNDKSARAFIADELGPYYLAAYDSCGHPAMRCDYFRLCYILLKGGFYVDADEHYQGTDLSDLFKESRLQVQPLCYDTITSSMVSPHDFLYCRKSAPGWIFYLNNNPLIAPRNHSILKIALSRATHLLQNSIQPHDIQSITGPGNLSASVVMQSLISSHNNQRQNIKILQDWDATSISKWPLSYRNDERNWRLWRGPH